MTPEQTAAEPVPYPVGTPVRKLKGYAYPGEVRAAFYTRAGELRYAVEAIHWDFRGMLRVFTPEEIYAQHFEERRTPGPVPDPRDEALKLAAEALNTAEREFANINCLQLNAMLARHNHSDLLEVAKELGGRGAALMRTALAAIAKIGRGT